MFRFLATVATVLVLSILMSVTGISDNIEESFEKIFVKHLDTDSITLFKVDKDGKTRALDISPGLITIVETTPNVSGVFIEKDRLVIIDGKQVRREILFSDLLDVVETHKREK